MLLVAQNNSSRDLKLIETPSRIMLPAWVHCNVCQMSNYPLSGYMLTPCGHVICISCAKKCGQSEPPSCLFCKAGLTHPPMTADHPKLNLFFTDFETNLRNTARVSDFQEDQINRLVKVRAVNDHVLNKRSQQMDADLAAAREELAAAEKKLEDMRMSANNDHDDDDDGIGDRYAALMRSPIYKMKGQTQSREPKDERRHKNRSRDRHPRRGFDELKSPSTFEASLLRTRDDDRRVDRDGDSGGGRRSIFSFFGPLFGYFNQRK